MLYDFDKAYTYEENCEEILSYMQCEDESFDFGEGKMIMESSERGMYKCQILPYLNRRWEDSRDTEFNRWWKKKLKSEYESKLERQFDDYVNYKLMNKLNNKYDKKQLHKKQMRKRYESYLNLWYPSPYWLVKDKNGKEYFKQYGIDGAKKCLKKVSVKKMRNSKYKDLYFPKGNSWKKTYDLWWNLY